MGFEREEHIEVFWGKWRSCRWPPIGDKCIGGEQAAARDGALADMQCTARITADEIDTTTGVKGELHAPKILAR